MNDIVERVLQETNVVENPYFVALRDGSFERDDFVETQIQFYYAVVFFSRPMAVVAAKIPSPQMRVEVMRNVWEEHGEGDSSSMHGETFQLFLQRLAGVSLEGIEHRALWPEVRAFNTALIGCAVHDDWEVGTACFGTIERMFVDISNWIGRAVVNRGWLSGKDLVHYNVHEKLDVKHAADFLAVLQREGNDPVLRYRVEQGVRLGAYIFDSLYRDLHRARRRRLDSSVRGAQSHIYRG